MSGTWLRGFVVFSMMAAAAQAAPPLTEIQDVLYKANGTLFDGVAQIEWKGFQSADGSEVPQNTVGIRVTRGFLRTALVPTTNALRPVVYTVRFNSDGKTQFVETWAVPPSAAVLKLRDVRTVTPVAASLTTAPSPSITIQDVPGLRTELDLRPVRGIGWIAGRAVAIGASGALEAVGGSDGDCVRVDGTAGPCGSTPVFVDGETPAGVQNGANRSFLLSRAPFPAASLRLYRNGLNLVNGRDYTLSGDAVTLASGLEPLPGDVLQCWYRLSGGQESNADGETPAGAIDGVNAFFTLLIPPLPAASLQVFRNGVLQKAGVDYSLSANLITFFPASTPVTGDVLQVSYRH